MTQMTNIIAKLVVANSKKRLRSMRLARVAVGLCAGVFLVGFAFTIAKQTDFTLAGLLAVVGTLTGFFASFTLAENLKLLILDEKETLAVLKTEITDKIIGDFLDLWEK